MNFRAWLEAAWPADDWLKQYGYSDEEIKRINQAVDADDLEGHSVRDIPNRLPKQWELFRDKQYPKFDQFLNHIVSQESEKEQITTTISKDPISHMQAQKLFQTNFTVDDVREFVQWMIDFGVLKGSIGHGRPLIPQSDVAYKTNAGGFPEGPKTNPYIKTQILPAAQSSSHS